MNKTEISTIAEKNRIVQRIMDVIMEKDRFVLLGHKDPDTDCIASLAAFALLLVKFNKEVTIFLAGPVMAHFSYLLAICKYNGVSVAYGAAGKDETYSAVVILDTPKPEMIALNDRLAPLMGDPGVRKIEIDHHLAADSAYSGDPGYRLVSEASSTCELIGYLLLKMSRQKDRFKKIDFFSRNLTLAILTGLVADSQMGRYLKTRKEKFYYGVFMRIFNGLLGGKPGGGNFSSMETVFDVIQNFSVQERRCYEGIMGRKNTERSIHHICLDAKDSAEYFAKYGMELVVNVSKAAADSLAEECQKLGLVVYYDDPSLSDFVQFRLRRSARFITTDLRDLLEELKIGNGGGHPGAIGFRVRKDEITDIGAYTADLVARIEGLVGAGG
ncbi:MAG: DHH family phosphoesterase [Treponema sp.]|jgi:nanoRNase/pAp phosphatase (c-di-AMP/oligoRNAs hydrolase)|nr:DHH family phosphoesterase [Treponema sp.]